MIKLMRLDERFIHGQVAFAWTNNLAVDCIFIANDDVSNDRFRQNSLKLAAPVGTKFICRSIDESIEILKGEKIKKYKVFLIVDNTDDALTIIESVPEIKQLNLGNMKKTENRDVITNSVALSAKDIDNIIKMVNLGTEVECRAVPTDKKIDPLKKVEERKYD